MGAKTPKHATARATAQIGRDQLRKRRAMRPCCPVEDHPLNNLTTAPSAPNRNKVAPTVMARTNNSARPKASSPNFRATNKENRKPPKAPATLSTSTLPEPPKSRCQEPSRRGGVGLDSVKGSLYVQQEAGGKWQPRQESNLDQTFRKRLFYPLNYGAVRQRNIARCEAAEKSPASSEERGRGLVGGKAPWAGWAILDSNQ